MLKATVMDLGSNDFQKSVFWATLKYTPEELWVCLFIYD